MKELLELYGAFFRIGLFTFGGGYAMLPMLTREVVNRFHWATDEELLDCYAIGQCTPGVIAMNVSTFIGQKKDGVKGAIAAGLGFLTGPLVIITLIAAFLQNFAQYPVVQHAFAGIRVCVCVLILQAVLRLWKKSVVDAAALAIFLVVFALNAFSSVLPVKIPAAVLVLMAGAAGIILSLRRASSAGKGGDAK